MKSRPGDPQAGRSHTLMSGVDRPAAAPGGRPASIFGRLFGRVLGRRRNYLVDRSYQVRSALVGVLGMGFLAAFSVALFRLLSFENARDLARQAPLLAHGVPASDGRSVLYVVAVGILFVAAVFVVEILETHKTAGVVYKVTRGLTELEAGRWGTKVTLRRHDNFKEMEEAFNLAARALREKVEDDLHGLQGIEGQLRLLARELENGNREGALVLLRQIEGEVQTMRERRRTLLRGAPGEPSEPRI